MPASYIWDELQAPRLVVGDLFQFAQRPDLGPCMVLAVTEDRVDFSLGRERWWCTMEEFRAWGPFCSMAGRVAFVIMWCYENGMTAEETRERVEKLGELYDLRRNRGESPASDRIP